MSLESRRAGRLRAVACMLFARARACAARCTPVRGASSSDRCLARTRAGLFKTYFAAEKFVHASLESHRAVRLRAVVAMPFFTGHNARARMMRAIAYKDGCSVVARADSPTELVHIHEPRVRG